MSNVWAIAESKFYDALKPTGIYDGGTMVGFLAYGRNPHDDQYWLYRFMIDEIRGLSPEIPIVLCRETPEMWKRFKDELNVGPANCGCGTVPRARTPGGTGTPA